MSTLVLTDSATMLRRNLRHALRYPSVTISALFTPILMLLLFRYVFGQTLGQGLGGGHYIDYLAPGIVVMTATAGSMGTAIGVNADMTQGIINRFRTMPITRSSVLNGHVVGNVLQTLLVLGLVIGVVVATGFRPTASGIEWLAAVGLLALLALALTWLSAVVGLACRSPETASNAVLPVQFLPFVGSAFVPTDSMPASIRWFAEYQPFTPIIETLRGLLTGTAVGTDGIVAVGWGVGLTVLGFGLAQRLFNRPAG